MSQPATLSFGSLLEASRFSLPSDVDDSPLVKLGEHAYWEVGGRAPIIGLTPDTPVIPLPAAEAPDISPISRFVRRAYDWDIIMCLKDHLPGIATYSILWKYCDEHIPWLLRFEISTQVQAALDRLLASGLIVETGHKAYRLTGAGVLRWEADYAPPSA